MTNDKSDTPRARLACNHSPLPETMIDVRLFTETMAQLAATACVATAAANGKRFGRTITTTISLSTQPPSLLISITKDTDLARTILDAKAFSLAMLAEDQSDLGDIFAGKTGAADRFTLGEWHFWPSGQPKLAHSATGVDCSLAGIIEMDTHYLFAGIPIAAEVSDRKPLVWYQREYHTLD